MLDDHFSTTVIDVAWNEIAARAVLPCPEEDYFGSTGATPTSPDTRRRYRRIRARGHITVKRGSNTLAAYIIDISPAGVGFYSPVQLFPRERVVVSFDGYGALELQISRCRKIRHQCYSCGGNFTHGNMSPGVYREFLRFLKV
jgi:hypothetical protein